MAEDRFLIALNDSIDRLAAGESIDDCAAAYPDYADQLRLYLTLGQLPRRAHVPAAEVELARTRIRTAIDNALEGWDGSGGSPGFSPWIPLLIVVVALPLLLVLGSQFFSGGAQPESAGEGLEVTPELVPPVTIEATHTATATATETVTLTATSTATATVTSSATATLTATSTATATVTSSATATLTPTSTATRTPTSTPGETVCVPAAPDGWVSYRVEAGDTLSGLAAATGTTVAQITSVNCLEDARFIVAGQPLFLPMEPVFAASTPTEEPAVTGGDDPAPGPNPPPPPADGGSDGGSGGGGSDDNDDDDNDDDNDDDDNDDDNDD